MTVTRDFDTTLHAISDVEGWMSEAQARVLWDEAAAVAPGGRIVEIGSFRGRSAIVLATAAPAGVDINTIDPHAGGDRGPREIAPEAQRGNADHDLFLRNLQRAGVRDRIVHIRKMSSEAHQDVLGEIDLLYIDGAHRFGPARQDIVQWGARVAPGGTLLIHDSFNSIGVMGAQLATLFLGGDFRYEGRAGSLARYRRTALGPAQRAVNGARQLAEVPYFSWSLLIKAMIAAGLGRFTRLVGWRGEGWPY